MKPNWNWEKCILKFYIYFKMHKKYSRFQIWLVIHDFLAKLTTVHANWDLKLHTYKKHTFSKIYRIFWFFFCLSKFGSATYDMVSQIASYILKCISIIESRLIILIKSKLIERLYVLMWGRRGILSQIYTCDKNTKLSDYLYIIYMRYFKTKNFCKNLKIIDKNSRMPPNDHSLLVSFYFISFQRIVSNWQWSSDWISKKMWWHCNG